MKNLYVASIFSVCFALTPCLPALAETWLIPDRSDAASAIEYWTGPWVALHFGISRTTHGLGPMVFNRPMSAEVMSHHLAADRSSVSRLSIGYTALIGSNVTAGLQFEAGGDRSPGVIGQSEQGGRDSTSAAVRIEQGPSYTLAARIGYLPNPYTQLYALAGYSRIATSGEVTMTRNGVSIRAANNDFTIEGTTFGLGIETRIGQRNSVGIEVRNTGFRSRGLLRGTAAENTPADAVLDSENQSILLTFTHRF